MHPRAILNFACAILLLGVASGQTSTSKTPRQSAWPTLREFGESDRGWQRLSDLGISADEFTAIQRLTSAWVAKHCPPIRDKKESADRVGSFSSKLIGVHPGGPMLTAINELGDWEGDSRSCPCSPNLNCRNWLVDLHGDTATALLEYSGFGLVMLQSSNRGYFDVATAANRHHRKIEFTIWRFDGNRYEAFRCASLQYARTAVDKVDPIAAIDKNAALREHPCR